MKTVLICVAIAGASLVSILFGLVMYIGIVGPETFVVPGRQMTTAHTRIIRELDLLDDAETIQYFYSDALTDIRNGMYFITDRKLVLYNDDWEEPGLIALFSDIVDARIERNDSFFDDSYITITLNSGEEWSFPVSSERGADKAFHKYMVERIDGAAGQDAPTPADRPRR